MCILLSADGSLYVGHTSNLETRLSQHQSGEGGDYTSRRLPVQLLYSEDYPSVFEAVQREREVKGWSTSKKFALIHGRHDLLPALSRNRVNSKSTRPTRRPITASRAALHDHTEPVDGRPRDSKAHTCARGAWPWQS
ncbi:MAG TPA: GIY-YIG nuclease family protein [Dehalococcoidia bacterium]